MSFVNSTDSLYWFDKPLKYSQHAEMRSLERGIPVLEYLPPTAKLVDCFRDTNGFAFRLVFKIEGDLKDYYIVLAHCGEVVTVYLPTKNLYETKENQKNYKRSANKKFANYFGAIDHELIPDNLKLRYW